MKCLDKGADHPGAAQGGPLRLDVLVVYEDFRTGLRARQTLDQVVQALPEDADVRANLWRVDVLREPGVREQVAKEAAEADIVFFSWHGQRELSASIALWFQEWLEAKGSEPCALVVSLDAPAKDTPHATRLVDALGVEARRGGAEVFVHLAEAEAELETTMELIQRRAEMKTMLLEEVLHRGGRQSFRGWGINE